MRKSLSIPGRSLHHLTKNFLLLILLFLWSGSVLGQNSLNSGSFPGGSWGSGQTMTSSAGSSLIITKSAPTTGDYYFRFYGDGSPCGEYQADNNGDYFTNSTKVTAPNGNCGSSNAWRINVPAVNSNVVFKTDGGNDGIDTSVAFVVQGAVRSVSTVAQSPIAASVVAGQNVTITATLDGALSTGQQVYIRYSKDNFATSTISTGTVSGTTATFTIPAATNTAAAVVKYYILTSGSTLPTHADADLMTINLNNNSGSNYSYTVNTPGTIYLHNFGTTTISTHPYTVSPTATPTAGTLNSNLSSSSWSNSVSTWSSAGGNTGNAIVIAPSTAAASTATLTFTVASGYQLSLSSYSYWRQRSASGIPTINSITVNGTTISPSADTVPTTGATITTTNVANTINGLTGTVTVVLNLAAASAGGGTLRLDDFTLNGNVTATAPAVAPIISGVSVASPGSGTSGYVGSTVTLTGTGFTGVSTVKVGGSAGTVVSGFTVVNDTTITFPAIDASGQIYIENSGGNATSSASYATLGYITTTTGAWSTAATWLGGSVPPSATTTNVTIAHNISGTSGTINVGKLTVNTGITLTNSASVTINVNTASANSGIITNAGTLTTAAAITNSGTFTNNGTFQINANGSIATNAPVYGSGSTLIYNGVSGYGVNTEWTVANGTIGTTGGFPQNVTLTSSSVNMPASTARGLAGTLTISTGSTLNLGSSIGGDLNVGGNFSNTGTFNANSRSVTFNGSANQTIVATGVASTFAYINYNSSSASAVLNINENITVANELRLSQGKVTVANAKTVGVSNNATVVATSGNFSTATTGTINFLGTGTTTGTIDFYPAVAQTPSTVLSVSYSTASTIQNSLTLNSNSFITTAPKYASGSTLIYNSGGNYSRGVEWGSVGATFPANGYPHSVTVQNGTTLKIATGLSGTLLANGNLTLGIAASAGSLDMENTANSLQVNGNVTIGNTVGTSSLTLSTVAGGDLFAGGNWTRNTTNGSFVSNSRTVTFNGSLSSDQTINGATTFDFLTVNRTGATGNLVLAANIIVNKDLTLTNKSIVLGGFNLTLPNKESIITANANSYINATGTGKLIRQNIDSTADWIFPMGVAAAGRYAPLTIKNLSGTTEIGVNVNTTFSKSVSVAANTLKTEWRVSSTNSVSGNIRADWTATEQNTGVVNPGSGDLGVYNSTVGTNYILYDVTLAQYNTQATGVSLANTGTNSIIIGNDDSITLSNDECSGAKIVTVDATAISGSNTGASTSLAAACGGSVANDVWYKFTTTDAGNYKVDVTGASGVDVVLNLRSGVCNTTTSLACTDATGNGATETITQLLDANTTYFYRVYSYSTLTAGSFTTSVSTVPTLTVTPASLNFGDVSVSTNSASQNFSLSGSLLKSYPGNIAVNAPTGFQVSLDNAAWTSTVNVPFTSSLLASTTIYTRLISTTTCGAVTGNITFSGGSVTVTPTVALTANAVILSPTATAGTDVTATTFEAHWNAIAGATGYLLDVYTKGTVVTTLINATFDDVAGTGGNSGGWSGSIATGTIPTAYTTAGWVFANSAGADKSIKVGSGSNLGVITTPELTVNGSGTLTFRAGAWDGTSESTTLKLSATNATLSVATVTLVKGSFSTYSVNITGVTGIVKISFTGNAASNSRFFIDDIKVTTSGIGNIAVSGYSPKTISGGSTVTEIVSGLSLNTQYYYVVRATNATCESAKSNEIGVLTNNNIVWNAGAWSNGTGPSETLDGIIRSTYSVGDAGQPAFTVKNLTVESTGLLEIKANNGVTVAGTITTADNKIVIDSDGSLLQTNTPASNNNSGKIIAKRDVKMSKADYTYWSSPVAGQVLKNTATGTGPTTYTTGGFSEGTPNNRIYDYLEPSDTFKATADANFASAKGYAIRGKDSYSATLHTADTSLKFTGIANNGSYTIGIQKSKNTTSGTPATTYTHGYNLIGNPYPSNINFIQFYNLDKGDGTKNSDVINAKAWFWTNSSPTANQGGSAYSGNNYATITLAGGTPPTTATGSSAGASTPNEFIKVGQGFIVEMLGTPPTGTTPTTATLKFDNSIRTNNSTGHFYNNNKSSDAINRYWVKLISPQNFTNTILVAHMDGATNNYDANYDAELLTVGDDSFYSKLNTQKLQIQARSNPLSNDDIIPLGTKYAANGIYKISLGNKEGIFETDHKIYLKDKLTNTYTDLSANDYSFAASKGTDENRFEIVYKENAVLEAGVITKSDFTVYRDGESYVIKSSKSLGKIEIYDTSGRMLITSSTKENSIKIDASVLANGVYIIKAENSGDIKTKKILK